MKRLFAFALALLLTTPALADVSFPLVKDGKPAATVVWTGDNPDLAASVEDLRVYVKQITGAELDIRKQAEDTAGPTLHLGETAHYARTAAARERIDLDGFAVVPAGEDLVVTGKMPQGTSNGIITLLQDQFGVRWYWILEGWERVPEAASLTIDYETTDGAYVENPAFQRRIKWGDGDYQRRMRNSLSGVDYEFQGTSHDMGQVVPDSLMSEHPEYFALINGERTTSGQCFTHPDMFDLFMKYVRKGGRTFGLKDNGAVCQCEDCNEAHEGSEKYHGYTNVSDSYFPLLKRVAEQTAKEFPDATLGTFAYQTTNRPPRGIDHLGDNIHITLCIDTSQQFDPEYKAVDREVIEGWMPLIGKASFYDYLGLGYWTPRYFPGLMADQMRHAAENGVMGYFSHWGTMPSSSMPMIYLYSQMMWDTDIDERALIDEMIHDLYGDAADTMVEYFDHWEHAWTRDRDSEVAQLPWREKGKNYSRWLYGIDDFFGEMRIYGESDFETGEELLTRAREEVDNPVIGKRLHTIWFEYRFSLLSARTYFAAQNALYSEPETLDEAYVLSASATELFKELIFYYDFIKRRPHSTASDWPGKPFYVRCWGLRMMMRDAVLAPFVRWSVRHEQEMDPEVLQRLERSAANQVMWARMNVDDEIAERIYSRERRPRADGLLVEMLPYTRGAQPNWTKLPEIDAALWLYEERPENPERGKYDDPHKYFPIDPPDPEDHMVEWQGTWNSNNLKLRFQVTDDVHHEPGRDGGMDRADSIRIMLVPDRDNFKYPEHSWTYLWGGYHGTEADFEVGLSGGDSRVHFRQLPEDMEESAAREFIQPEIERDGNTTWYTLEIDWELIPDFDPEERKSLGIIVNVHDNDSDGQALQVAEYGSGITYRYRPSEASALRLMKN